MRRHGPICSQVFFIVHGHDILPPSLDKSGCSEVYLIPFPHSGRSRAGHSKVTIIQQHIEYLVGLMVIYPSTNWACDYLTSVMECDVLPPTQRNLMEISISRKRKLHMYVFQFY